MLNTSSLRLEKSDGEKVVLNTCLGAGHAVLGFHASRHAPLAFVISGSAHINVTVTQYHAGLPGHQ